MAHKLWKTLRRCDVPAYFGNQVVDMPHILVILGTQGNIALRTRFHADFGQSRLVENHAGNMFDAELTERSRSTCFLTSFIWTDSGLEIYSGCALYSGLYGLSEVG